MMILGSILESLLAPSLLQLPGICPAQPGAIRGSPAQPPEMVHELPIGGSLLSRGGQDDGSKANSLKRDHMGSYGSLMYPWDSTGPNLAHQSLTPDGV